MALYALVAAGRLMIVRARNGHAAAELAGLQPEQTIRLEDAGEPDVLLQFAGPGPEPGQPDEPDIDGEEEEPSPRYLSGG